MGPNRRAQKRQRAAARAAEAAKRAYAQHKALADAQKIVAIWGRPLDVFLMPPVLEGGR